MRVVFLFVFLIVSLTEVSAQTINIRINNLNQGKAQFSYIKGEKSIAIDSIAMNDKGEFSYTFGKNASHPGLYRLTFAKGRWIDFIIDNEDVNLSTDASNVSDNMKVSGSESNKLYFDFVKLNRQFKVKAELLQIILARYPKDDDYYKTTKGRVIQLQDEYLQFVNVTSQKNPRSFAARYIKSIHLPVIDVNLPMDKQVGYLRSHSLDNTDFDDDDLINSDAFTSKAIEYLTLYRNPQLPKEGLEKEFIGAVDTILNKAKVNQLVYQNVTEYLIDGFKKFGFDQIIDYIVDNYVIKDDICLDEKLQNSIQRRMDQAKHLKIGATVPLIISADSTGKEVNLNNITGDKTLIIFYASWCPHCQELLPKINELYTGQSKGGMKVVAISIDTNKADWLGFVRKNNFKWINVSDLKGWFGKAAQDYYLYATPTMFLVNEKKEIIAKPANWEEVRKWME